ncbi:hypothetical protein [Clostridium sp.]|jgi:hypothetical protein|uniref:hypothetical protein n=1 Tax=Clostridium sp. TaxID=1506 RepID=UPI0025BF8617|nr:hypothetical protein [Clostridium sp.]MCI9070685.1 hypothetical protein [Clostridium sp.]
MNTINEISYKATTSSAATLSSIYGPYINWINFGKDLTLKPGESYEVINKLDGTNYTFHLILNGIGPLSLTTNSLPEPDGTMGSDYSNAVQGYPAFYCQGYSGNNTGSWNLNIEDLYLSDENGNKLYNYSLIAGFFEQASSPSSTQVFNESNSFETSRGSWSAYNSFYTTGITGLPQLTYTGINSNKLTKTMSGSNFSINQYLLFRSDAATNCKTNITSESNNQAVAFGIVVVEDGLDIQKSIIKQPQVLENNEDIIFSFKFSPVKDITGDLIDYVIVDTLPEGLSCNKSDITILQKSANNEFNSIEFSLTFIDTTATITIPFQNITTSSDVIINFPTKIINKELLPREFTNICSIDLIYPYFEPQSKISLSNPVNVNLPQEDTSQKLTHYLIVLFLYYCCCCYCNKE